MSRLTALVLVLLAGLLPAPAGARRSRRNDLIRVTSPPIRGTALAHPFVNVIVFFDARAHRRHEPFRGDRGGRRHPWQAGGDRGVPPACGPRGEPPATGGAQPSDS